MRKLVLAFVVVLLLMAIAGATAVLADTDQEDACWGQASAVFAALGEMGDHSSNPPDLGLKENGRLGLRNLARYLFENAVDPDGPGPGEPMPDDSMASLGQWVAVAFGLSIDACQ